MRQVAKIFLRGRRYTDTMRNLDDGQREQLDGLIRHVNTMPEMQSCKREFCRALARTIRNEYCDPVVAQADFDIAVMKAAVTVLFHDPVKQQVLEDPIQVKKIMSQWVFNYLRQIIRENKIPAVTDTKMKKVPGETALRTKICKMLDEQQIPYDIEEGSCLIIHLNTDRCPHDMLLALNMRLDDVEDRDGVQEFIDLVGKSGCKLMVQRNKIVIQQQIEMMVPMESRDKTNLKITGFELDDDDNDDEDEGFQHALEHRASRRKPLKDNWDNFKEAERYMPEEALAVYKLMCEPPLEFLEQNNFIFDSRYSARAIARYLNVREQEIKERMRMIKSAFLSAGIVGVVR